MSLYLGPNSVGLDIYDFSGIAFGNNTFVLVSSALNTKILYKVGTNDWQYLVNPNIPISAVYSIKYCNDRFIARYDGGHMYSFNGITWTKFLPPSGYTVQSVEYFKGKYYLQTSSSTLHSTLDFITYTQVTLPSVPRGELYSNANILCFVNARLNPNDIDKLVYSFNGINWYYKTADYSYRFIQYDYSTDFIPLASNNISNLDTPFLGYVFRKYLNDLKVPDGVTDATTYAMSPPIVLPKSHTTYFVIWDGTRHVILANDKIYTTDMVSLTYKSTIPPLPAGNSYRYDVDISFVGGKYFLYCGNQISYSLDLVSWTPLELTLPTSSKKVLIATKKTYISENDMINLKPIDCEFHSDLPYLTYKRFDAVVTDYGYVTHYTGYLWASNGGPTYDIVIAEFPEAFYSNYLDRQLIVIINNNMSLSHFAEVKGLRNRPNSNVAYGQNWIDWVPNPPRTNIPERSTTDTPSSNYRYLIIPKEATTSNRHLDGPYRKPSVSVLVTNFKLDGTYVPPAVNNYAQGIKIKNNSFFINGYDLFSLNYLSNVPLSEADVGITTEQGKFYLVGEDDSVSGMQLLSAPGRTRLFKGNHVLFDTLYGRRGHVFAGIGNYFVANDEFYWGTKSSWTHDLIIFEDSTVTESTKVNVLIKVKTKGTNIKHDEVLVSTNSSALPYYPSDEQSYGALSFCLDTSEYQLVAHQEYYIQTSSFPLQATAFYIYRVYIRRVIRVGGRVTLELFVQHNENYANGSGNMQLDVKAIMFV